MPVRPREPDGRAGAALPPSLGWNETLHAAFPNVPDEGVPAWRLAVPHSASFIPHHHAAISPVGTRVAMRPRRAPSAATAAGYLPPEAPVPYVRAYAPQELPSPPRSPAPIQAPLASLAHKMRRAKAVHGAAFSPRRALGPSAFVDATPIRQRGGNARRLSLGNLGQLGKETPRRAPAPEAGEVDDLGLFGFVGGFYDQLLQGVKCTGPESLAYNERFVEIDLSNEFPPERREAQIDPQAPPPGHVPRLDYHSMRFQAAVLL